MRRSIDIPQTYGRPAAAVLHTQSPLAQYHMCGARICTWVCLIPLTCKVPSYELVLKVAMGTVKDVHAVMCVLAFLQ